jgi:hypothetical protein
VLTGTIELSAPALIWLSRLLFETYPLYVDRNSRRAAESCLRALIANPKAADTLGPLVDYISTEVKKGSLAPANYFVLAEWCSVFLDELTNNLGLWAKWWSAVLHALAISLERTLGLCRQSVTHSAIILARRALRRIFRQEKLSQGAASQIIASLTKKESTPTARNSVLLGVVAGVCVRIDEQRPIFESHKKELFTFYNREIIGSRVTLPPHIANGLQDLFENFVTYDDFKKEIVAPVEKALLRAPEIVLNDLISPVIQSLPKSMDLSEILLQNFLKPLLSNIKSSNATIRSGALKTFQVLVSWSHNDDVLSKVADELLNPLKQNKVPGAEQKILLAQMLASLPGSALLVKKLPAGIGPLALKEPNEAALDSQLLALTKQARHAFEHNVEPEAVSSECFVKGLADKRPNVRRLWALRLGDVAWNLPQAVLRTSAFAAFISPIVGKTDVFKEVASNPVQAAQNGLATAACVFTALLAGTLRDIKDAKGTSLGPSKEISQKVLAWDGKPSFLLNHRVFTKFTSLDDALWAIRAIAATSLSISSNSHGIDVERAWSQSFHYFITASSLPHEVHQEASRLLSKSYMDNASKLESVMIDGIWLWLQQLIENEKDSVAIASKSAASTLSAALRSICSTQKNNPGAKVESNRKTQELQMIQLLVLARGELIPKVSWIDLCLRVNVDPGQLVTNNSEACLQQIVEIPAVSLVFDSIFISYTNMLYSVGQANLAFVYDKLHIALLQISHSLRQKLQSPCYW